MYYSHQTATRYGGGFLQGLARGRDNASEAAVTAYLARELPDLPAAPVNSAVPTIAEYRNGRR